MMDAMLSPGEINGHVCIPASKSAFQRACALALLNKGRTTIHNPGKSFDDHAAVQIIKEMGAECHFEQGQLHVYSSGNISPAAEIHCGESGLSLRMFAPIAAISDHACTFIGSGSLLKRPVPFFDEVFPRLGVNVITRGGYLPITVKGPLVPCELSINAAQSSQYLTGLLFAYAATATKPVTITVNNLKSRPYIDLSIQMMQHFGYRVNQCNYEKFIVFPSTRQEKEIIYTAEADWSSAAFMLVAGAIAGDISIDCLDLNSVQADRAIMDVLARAGAAISIKGNRVLINNRQPLHAFEFDATDCPDLFPPLVALASYCTGESVIRGTGRLAGKESDRAHTLLEVFGKMGISIRLEDDCMFIRGGIPGKAEVTSHNDHRIAMACAVAALKASGSILITHAEAVNKSYPAFFSHLQMLGAAVSLS